MSIFTLSLKFKVTCAVIVTHTSRVNDNQSIRIQEPAMLLKPTYARRINSTFSLIFKQPIIGSTAELSF